MSYYVNHVQLSAAIPTSGSSAVSGEIPAVTDGWARLVYFATPGFSANVSGDFTIRNPGGKILYSSDADIMSSTRTGTVDLTNNQVPVLGGGYIVLNLSNIPGSAAGVSATPSTATFDVYMG